MSPAGVPLVFSDRAQRATCDAYDDALTSEVAIAVHEQADCDPSVEREHAEVAGLRAGAPFVVADELERLARTAGAWHRCRYEARPGHDRAEVTVEVDTVRSTLLRRAAELRGELPAAATPPTSPTGYP